MRGVFRSTDFRRWTRRFFWPSSFDQPFYLLLHGFSRSSLAASLASRPIHHLSWRTHGETAALIGLSLYHMGQKTPRTQNPIMSILVIHSVPVDDFVLAILLDRNATEFTQATHQFRVSQLKSALHFASINSTVVILIKEQVNRPSRSLRCRRVMWPR